LLGFDDHFERGAVDARGSAEVRRHFQAIVVEINHDDLGRREELRSEQGRKPNRPRADNGDRASGLNLAVEHPTFEPCRQDVAEHYERFFIRPFGNRIEASICVGSADEFSLCAVDAVAEDPAAGRAVRVHLFSAINAFATGAHTRDEDMIAWFERRDGRPDLVNNANALMTQNAAGLASRDVTLEDV
jgi:hypothetical protein